MEFRRLAENVIVDGSVDDTINVLLSAIDLAAKKHPVEFSNRRSEIEDILFTKLHEKISVNDGVGTDQEPSKNQRRVIRIKLINKKMYEVSQEKTRSSGVISEEVEASKKLGQENQVRDQVAVFVENPKPTGVIQASQKVDILRTAHMKFFEGTKRKFEARYMGARKKIRVNLGSGRARRIPC